LAARLGLDDIIKFLLDNGARIDIQSRKGQSPLDLAEINNQTKW
jgi:ankyrin repeat protein